MKLRFKQCAFLLLSMFLLISGCAMPRKTLREKVAPELPNVQREFRAAWIASVANINWPSRPGLSTQQQKEEAIYLLDLLQDHNFNTAILQIRPQCDALYKSDLEPWSYYLTGEQGKAPDPYYDPLEFWIEEAHKRGIELHAWLNPYRAHHVSGGEVSDHSVVNKYPDLALELSSGYWWLDPSKKGTRDHSLEVVMDIVKRYDIDGIHFDDYFYPYPSYHNGDFPDDESWQEYIRSGGDLSRGDWRRESVNKFIKQLYKNIKKEKPHVKFGLSPFGIWRPGNPESIKGFDQYDKLYADAKLWLNEGWIDYWTPQLYWTINKIPQSFPVLLGWWENENRKNRHFWPGINISGLRQENAVDETINQIMVTRGMLPEAPGNVHWSIGPMVHNVNLATSIVEGPYAQQALVPPCPWLDRKAPARPDVNTVVQNESLKINWSHEKTSDVFHWILYYTYGNEWKYKILSGETAETSIPLFKIKNRRNAKQEITQENINEIFSPVDEIAVSAVDRLGNESVPVKITIDAIGTPQLATFDTYYADSKPDFQLPFLNQDHENFKFCETPLKKLKNEHVIAMLQQLKDQFGASFQYEVVGHSVQDRPIHLVRMGTGDTKVLLWSQMHGDEPTATAALFDIFNYLLKNEEKPFVQNILNNVTLLAVPMLNPDGAEVFKRRNAQGIDINRDARDLQSPEGRLLFNLKEKYKPDFGFNLHDQDSRTTVGKTNNLAALALMAPPYDESCMDNAVRIRAKKIVDVIRRSVEPYLAGHISKYKADYMPRSFGDSMQNWGVSTVLVESSGWYEDKDAFLIKMNFIALISCFNAIADGSYEYADARRYDALPENGKSLYDLLIQDVMVLDGTGIPPFKSDVAINYFQKSGYIVDTGDLNVYAAKDTIAGTGLTLAPGLIGIIHDSGLQAKNMLDKSREMLENGFTTILFSEKIGRIKEFEEFKSLLDENNLPANLGVILYLDKKLRSPADTLQVLRSLEKNMVGIIIRQNLSDENVSQKFLNKPMMSISDVNLNTQLEKVDTQSIRALTMEQAKEWKLGRRGKIRRGQIADFVLFSSKSDSSVSIHSVFIKGYRIWHKGDWIDTKIEGERWIY